ncbi:hypothetical protein MSPP1_000014 [Malassezia sp. CBS 17886]|nr:hypothetical protein MSPP1_000014 [Malassezia sp. CBS 17886]
MDADVASIAQSLDRILKQKEHVGHLYKRPFFFTNAVLNTGKRDILELIRDADQMEAALFTYRSEAMLPVPRDVAPGSSAPEAELPPLGTQQLQLCDVPVPTPLRGGAESADTAARGAPGEAHTYLVAAERLLQSYHNAPRARKHIRMLLKRDGELQRHIARYSKTIANAQRPRTEASAASPVTPARALVRPRTREGDELRRVKEEVQRERMEIIALESMISEMEEEQAAMLGSTGVGAAGEHPDTGAPHAGEHEHEHIAGDDNAQDAAGRVTFPVGAGDAPAEPRPQAAMDAEHVQATSTLRQTTTTPFKQSTASAVARQRIAGTPGKRFARSGGEPVGSVAESTRRAGASALSASTSATPARQRRTLDGTPRRPLAASVSSPRPAAARSPPKTPHGASPTPRAEQAPTRFPATPSTASPSRAAARRSPDPAARSPLRALRAPPAKGAATLELAPLATVPAATKDLERIAGRLWAHIGETLRYAAPAYGSAPFADTYAILRSLAHCGTGNDVPWGAPLTSAPAQNPATPLGVAPVAIAYVLLLLFRAQTHSLTLPQIKAATRAWWQEQGQAAFQGALQTQEGLNELVQHTGLDRADVEQTGDVLASRAVYGLVAKKLLRIRRAGGAANVEFA